MKTEIATRTVTILVRYFVKATQTVTCKVLNGENKKYFVTLHKNGNTTCTCKHGESAGNHAHCYHVKHVQSVEASRTQEQQLTPAAPYDVIAQAEQVAEEAQQQETLESTQEAFNAKQRDEEHETIEEYLAGMSAEQRREYYCQINSLYEYYG